MGIFSFFSKDKKSKLNESLVRTKESFWSKVGRLFTGKVRVDEELLDQLEEALLLADVGIDTTTRIISRFQEKAALQKDGDADALKSLLKEEMATMLVDNPAAAMGGFALDTAKPYVVMVVGVNGVGKTTTIGKLAHQYAAEGKKVVIGAADTFRAAAVDQLKVWAQRSGAGFISQGMNADPAAVAFDTLQHAVAHGADLVLIDTAGRLHNKVNLMNELSKIKRVMQKLVPDAPHDVMLVLDASTGQNAIEQARQFTAATEVSSLALTKLDGTAKGGVVIGISDQFNIPVRFIGLGEGVEDLQVFDRKEFVDSLFE